MIKPSQIQWNTFVKTCMRFDGVSNVIGDFKSLSRTQAVAYFEYLKAAWAATKEQFIQEEFCKINGEVPIQFFEKNIRDSAMDVVVLYEHEQTLSR